MGKVDLTKDRSSAALRTLGKCEEGDRSVRRRCVHVHTLGTSRLDSSSACDGAGERTDGLIVGRCDVGIRDVRGVRDVDVVGSIGARGVRKAGKISIGMGRVQTVGKVGMGVGTGVEYGGHMFLSLAHQVNSTADRLFAQIDAWGFEGGK